MPNDLKLGIAEIVLALSAGDAECEFEIPSTYVDFQTDAQPDLSLGLHCSQPSGSLPETKIFDSGGTWSLYGNGDRWMVCLRSPAARLNLYKLALVERKFGSGGIYARPRDGGVRPFPLEYPLAEVLMVNLLSRGRGVLLHAMGVSDGGEGILFAGTSGAGKSTMAGLWKNEKEATLLSDDRVIVRRKNEGFWMFGTPWHSDAQIASPDGAPLKQIFIIHHSSENRTVPMAPADATAQLLTRSFPTFWDADGMAFTVDFLSQLAHTVPCHELGFVPRQEVVDFVRCESAA